MRGTTPAAWKKRLEMRNLPEGQLVQYLPPPTGPEKLWAIGSVGKTQHCEENMRGSESTHTKLIHWNRVTDMEGLIPNRCVPGECVKKYLGKKQQGTLVKKGTKDDIKSISLSLRWPQTTKKNPSESVQGKVTAVPMNVRCLNAVPLEKPFQRVGRSPGLSAEITELLVWTGMSAWSWIKTLDSVVTWDPRPLQDGGVKGRRKV